MHNRQGEFKDVVNSGYPVLIIYLECVIVGVSCIFYSFSFPATRFLFILLPKSWIQTRERKMYSPNLLIFIVSKSFKIQAVMRVYK